MPTLLRIDRAASEVGASVVVVEVVANVVELTTTESNGSGSFPCDKYIPSFPLYDWPNKSDLFRTTFPPFSAEHRSDN